MSQTNYEKLFSLYWNDKKHMTELVELTQKTLNGRLVEFVSNLTPEDLFTNHQYRHIKEPAFIDFYHPSLVISSLKTTQSINHPVNYFQSRLFSYLFTCEPLASLFVSLSLWRHVYMSTCHIVFRMYFSVYMCMYVRV